MATDKNLLVSVVMPVYNGKRFIGKAIESVLGQTYQNFEFIIVDDGSTDGTAQVLRDYQSRFSRKLRAVFLKKNRGESIAANIGFKASRGELVARMDADDVSYPERIEKQVQFMLSHKNVVVLGTQADVVDGNDVIVGRKTFPLGHQHIYSLYGIYHPMLHPSCMFRRRLLPNKEKLWENTHEPNDDYITLFRLLSFGQFANLKDTLIAYRVHNRNKSLQNAKSRAFNILRIRLDAICRFGYKPSLLAILINIFQFLGILVLPERFIVPLYLVLRGMARPRLDLHLSFSSFRWRAFVFSRGQ